MTIAILSSMMIAFAMGVVVVLVGEVFQQAPTRNVNPTPRGEAVITAVVGVALLALGLLLAAFESAWALLFLFAGVVCLVMLVYGLFPERGERFWGLGGPLAVTFAAGAWLSYLVLDQAITRQYHQARAEEKARAEEAAFAETLRASRTNWRPGAGVTEFTLGPPVSGWLAVAPRVDVDGEHELELGPAARRVIPIRVVVLNDSYTDAALPVAGGVSDWRLTVREPGGGEAASWSIDVGLGEHQLGPAERREFEIPWDGRTAAGELAPPGRYVVSLRPAGGAAVAEATVAIVEAGAIVVPSEIERNLASQTETALRMRESMESGLRLDGYIRNTQGLRPLGR